MFEKCNVLQNKFDAKKNATEIEVLMFFFLKLMHSAVIFAFNG